MFENSIYGFYGFIKAMFLYQIIKINSLKFAYIFKSSTIMSINRKIILLRDTRDIKSLMSEENVLLIF